MALRLNQTEVELAYAELRRVHKKVREYTTSVIQQIYAGCYADKILEIGRLYRDFFLQFQACEAVPGLLAHARLVEGDNAYELLTEHNAVKNKMAAVQNFILTALPKHNNYLLLWQLNPDFSTTIREFSGAQTAPLVTLLNEVLA